MMIMFTQVKKVKLCECPLPYVVVNSRLKKSNIFITDSSSLSTDGRNKGTYVIYKRKPKKRRFIDGTLVSKLDAIGLTDRQAVHVISEVAQALGHNLDELVISRTTIQRARKRNRKIVAEKLKNSFSVNYIVYKNPVQTFSISIYIFSEGRVCNNSL